MVGGDIDGDGRGDLASALENGAAVFYGTQDGLAHAEFWPTEKKENVTDLAIADFDHDGFGDLAIGIDGIVDVVYGSGDGLTNVGRQRWSPRSPGIAAHGSRLAAPSQLAISMAIVPPIWRSAPRPEGDFATGTSSSAQGRSPSCLVPTPG